MNPNDAAEERAYWSHQHDVTTIMHTLDTFNAHIDFEPGYRVIYATFTKISEARAALLTIRETAPTATMVVDGTKATITIAMGGE